MPLDRDGELIRRVRELLYKHAHELWDRLYRHKAATDVALLCRPADDAYAEFTKQAGRRELVTGTPLTGYAHLLAGEIHVHEEPMLLAGVRTDITNVRSLKHLVLYCDRVLVRDPLLPKPFINGDAPFAIAPFRADEQGWWCRRIADGLRQLVDLAELVRTGRILLSAGFPKDWWTEASFQKWVEEGQPKGGPSQYAGDPYAPFLRNGANWNTDRILRAYPEVLNEEDLRRLEEFVQLVHVTGVTPFTSSRSIMFHLEQGLRILWGERPAAPAASVSPAIEFGFPALSEVSFADLTRLRDNEEIFADVRTALNKLGEVCAAAAAPDTYENYKALIHDNAEDIVGPSMARLTRLQRRTKALQLAGVGLGKAVSFGLNAAAKTGHAPGAGQLAGPAGSLTQKALGRRSKRTSEDLTIALGILRSITDY